MTKHVQYIRIALTAAIAAGASGAVWAAAPGCAAPDASARVDPIGPSRSDFGYVAPVLVRRCGSIDCHGSRFRNLRVYGYGGERRDGGSRPDFPPHVTREEADATYDSLIGLEPELMRDVVNAHGAGPERLSFVRKGRGDEDHKANVRITPGDPSDVCILTWLSNSVNKEACNTGGCVLDGGVLESSQIGKCP